MEIKLNQEEVFKMFKDLVPAAILPPGYHLVDMRLEGRTEILEEKGCDLVLILEKKNGEQKPAPKRTFVPLTPAPVTYEGGA
jgi:hypothetical protein